MVIDFPATDLLIFWPKKQDFFFFFLPFPFSLSEGKVSERSADMWPLPPALLAFLPLLRQATMLLGKLDFF